MKRILMLNYEFPPLGGGAANANYYLLKEFAKEKDLYIDLITTSPNNKFEIENFSENIRIFKLKVRKKNIHFWKMSEIFEWSYKAYFFTRKLIKKNNYDLNHCWFGWPSGFIGYLFRKRVPYIVALRGSDVPGYNPRLKNLDKIIFKPLSKLIWSNAKAVICNSLKLKELALKTKKIKIDIIYNGVDTDEFKPLNNKKKNKVLTLISTGRLIERKGYQYLIPALPKNVKLQLIGDGDYLFKLKKLAKDNNVDVEFIGSLNHSEIKKYLQTADIFVLPSLNEGMSNSILEAMACGLPIITTNTGGSQELINGNGFIVEKKSSKDLRKSIETFINEPKIIKNMGNKSRKISEKLNWMNVKKEYMNYY
jgi:L-malate glycosyltransferase